MSLTYGFYNSLNGDRKYDATQFSSIFDGLIRDGIFASIGDAMAVTSAGGLTITVGSGRAWFNHTWTLNDASMPLTLSASDLLLDRIDAVVLEVNADESARANSIKIVEGTPASSPAYPSLTNNALVHQYPLCYIYRTARSTEITQSNITNAIGTSACPFVTGILETVSIDAFIAQWGAEFTEWFETIKNFIGDDPVTNLAAQLMSHLEASNPHDITPEKIGAAKASHGAHVSFSTTAPVKDGTASAGSASTVARSDHIHPTDTSRAPAYTYTQSTITPGVSSLATGTLCFVYE